MDKHLKIERIGDKVFIEYNLRKTMDLKDSTLDSVLNDLALRTEALEDI